MSEPTTESKSKSLQLSRDSMKISAELGVDKNDMVAIVSARAERHLREQIAQLDSEYRKLSRSLSETNVLIEDAVISLGRSAAEAAAKTFVAAGDAFGVKGSYTISSALAFEDRPTRKTKPFPQGIDVTTQITFRGDESGNRYHAGGGSITRHQEVELSAEIRDLYRKRLDLETQIEDVQDRTLQLRNRLNNLASMERQARAELARKTLEATEEGQALLSSLDAVQEIPLLGM